MQSRAVILKPKLYTSRYLQYLELINTGIHAKCVSKVISLIKGEGTLSPGNKIMEYRCWSGQPQSTTTHKQIHTDTYPTHVILLADRSRRGKGLGSFDNRYARLGVSCLQPVGGRCEGGAGAGQTG